MTGTNYYCRFADTTPLAASGAGAYIGCVNGSGNVIGNVIGTDVRAYGDAITALDGGNWKVLYTDGSGNVTELVLGTAGDVLTSGGPAAAPTLETPSDGTVTCRFDYVYAESVGLCVGPNQPSSYITNLVYGAVTQQVEYLAFDDTTEEYTGDQTWQTWPNWNSNITVRGSSWYADATPGDVTWTLHYVDEGLTPVSIDLVYTGAAAGVTNLDVWAVSTNLTGITAGSTMTYWFSRDPADDPTGDVYMRSKVLAFEQQ